MAEKHDPASPKHLVVGLTARSRVDAIMAQWRRSNDVSDSEFSDIGRLLCDFNPLDLALMLVREQALNGPKMPVEFASAHESGGDRLARTEREKLVISRAEADIDAGQGIDDDAFKVWLDSLDRDLDALRPSAANESDTAGAVETKPGAATLPEVTLLDIGPASVGFADFLKAYSVPHLSCDSARLEDYKGMIAVVSAPFTDLSKAEGQDSQ